MEQFCLFVVWFVGGCKKSQYIIKKNEVELMLAAFKELHHSPGVNPHVKDRDNRAAKIYRITVQNMGPSGPYWWTTPGLDANKEVKMKGCQIWEGDIISEKTIFYDQSIDPTVEY